MSKKWNNKYYDIGYLKVTCNKDHIIWQEPFHGRTAFKSGEQLTKRIYYKDMIDADCSVFPSRKSTSRESYKELSINIHTTSETVSYHSDQVAAPWADSMVECIKIIKERIGFYKNKAQEEKATKAESRKTWKEKSPAEQIKEYKELLDLEIITQEEFNAKKKQLLGL